MIAKRVAATLGLLALVGCTLTQSELRKDDVLPRLGSAGRLITPRRCSLTMAIVSSPAGEPALAESVWRVADAQALDDDARRALEANGLRIGRITGELPAEVQAMLDAPPPRKVVPMTVILFSGDKTLVPLGPKAEQVSLFLNQGDKAAGKVYRDAMPCLRLAASLDDADGVAVRITPEVHHGPVRQNWGPDPNGALSGQQFILHNGQQEETFRDLAATLTLRPGQVAVIGGQGGRGGTLGKFLFSEPEGTSDRPLQKVLIVWASRVDPGPASPGASPVPPPRLEPVEPADVKGSK
jgi:hypothetical protein